MRKFVLILDDRQFPGEEIAGELNKMGFNAVFEEVRSYGEAFGAVNLHEPYLLLLDFSLSPDGREGRELAENLTHIFSAAWKGIIVGHSSQPVEDQEKVFGPTVRHFIQKGEVKPSDYPAILQGILDTEHDESWLNGLR